MILTDRQIQLFELVSAAHGDQKRKYTFEPYTEHLLSVARIVSEYVPDYLTVEIALCHDLIEDTDTDETKLFQMLLTCKYDLSEATDIVSSVVDLTDMYTKESHPHLNRIERKRLEAGRLGTIKPVSQSVKYADLIDNTSSIVAHDPEFAKTYLKEKAMMLDYMRGGNIQLLIKCCHTLHEALNHETQKSTQRN